MYCRNCGSHLPNHAKFCTYCGSTLNGPSQKKRGNQNGILYILLGLALCVILAVGIGFVLNRQEANKQSALPKSALSAMKSIGSIPSVVLTPAPTSAPAPAPAPTQAPPDNSSQPPETGWYVKDGTRYYYLNGVMMTGLQEIRGNLYYFYEDGALAVNTNVKYNGNILEAGNDGKINAITYSKIDGYWSDAVYKFKDGYSAYLLELEMPVKNCDQATVYIEASGQRGASVTSYWKIYVRSRGNWTLLDEVYYTEPSRTFEFVFQTPVEFDAIAAYPTARGSYTYNFDYYLVDVHMLQ